MTKAQRFAGSARDAPARVIGKSYWGVRGEVVVHGKSVAHESALERDFLWQMTLDPSATRIVSQPFTLHFTTRHGRRTKYTPDYLIEHLRPVPSVSLVECKHREDIGKQCGTLKPGLMEGRRHAREHGMRFVLLTEREVRTESLNAARFLNHFRHLPDDEGIEQHLIHRLAVLGTADPERLLVAALGSADPRREGYGYVWKLIAERRIECDLERPLTMRSPIWIDLHGDWRPYNPYSWRRIGFSVAAALRALPPPLGEG